MTTKAAIERLISQKVLAVAGVSRDPNKFGKMAYRTLKAKGYHVLPINPNAESIDGDPCYRCLKALPEKVGGLILTTQPAVSEAFVYEAAELGIDTVWLQQGSESNEAIRFCQEHGMNVISGECIMMYMPHPAFPHNVHKSLKGIFVGKPK